MKIEKYDKTQHFEQVCDLIKNHNDERLLSSSIDYFTNYNSTMDAGFVALNNQNKVIGFTGIAKLDNKTVKSITVVHSNYRKNGIGTKLMQAKLNKLDYTEIGLLNVNMIKIALKLGLKLKSIGQRLNGNFYLTFVREV